MTDVRRTRTEGALESLVTGRPSIAFFWWQHERAAQQREADMLAARRAPAPRTAEPEPPTALPTAG